MQKSTRILHALPYYYCWRHNEYCHKELNLSLGPVGRDTRSCKSLPGHLFVVEQFMCHQQVAYMQEDSGGMIPMLRSYVITVV